MNAGIVFKSVGHFFAKAIKAIVNNLPKAENALEKAEASKPVVELIEKAVAPELVPFTDAGYALLGEVIALLHLGGDAAAAKLADAGLDVAVINKAKDVYKQIPQIAALATKL